MSANSGPHRKRRPIHLPHNWASVRNTAAAASLAAAASVAARDRAAPSAVRAAAACGWPVAVRRSNSNTARQPLESCGVFCCRQATMRPTSGTLSPHRRQTSGVHAICCSQVPRFSCDDAGAITPVAPIAMARPRTIRCVGMDEVPSFRFAKTRNSARRRASSLPNECGHATLVQTKKCEVVPYSTLPIFFTAATNRALSSATNFENSGAS